MYPYQLLAFPNRDSGAAPASVPTGGGFATRRDAAPQAGGAAAVGGFRAGNPVNPAVNNVNLNLQSGRQNLTTDIFTNFQPTTIQVGQGARQINVGDKLTPAEFVALSQMIQTGAQTLQLSDVGKAVGEASRVIKCLDICHAFDKMG